MRRLGLRRGTRGRQLVAGGPATSPSYLSKSPPCEPRFSPEITGRLKLFQLGQRSFPRATSMRPSVPSQSEDIKPLAGETGALGLNGQSGGYSTLQFGRVQKGQFAIAHAEKG